MYAIVLNVELLIVKAERFYPWTGDHDAKSHLEPCPVCELENQAIAIGEAMVDDEPSPLIPEEVVSGIVHHVKLVIRLIHHDDRLVVRREILDLVLGDCHCE